MLIGISGKKNSGKSATALIMQCIICQGNWHTVAFADPVKDIVCMLIGCTREQLEDREFKEKPLNGNWWRYWTYLSKTPRPVFASEEGAVAHAMTLPKDVNEELARQSIGAEVLTPRRLLYLVGTKFGREMVHPDIWINSLFSRIKPSENYIISDVRFENEADAILEKSGVLIRIERPGAEEENYDSPETSLDDYNKFKYRIINGDGIDELTIKAISILRKEGIVE